MVWTTPKQFNPGDILTAADLNIYLRDNLLESEVMKCTTAGSHLTTDTGANLVERKVLGEVVDGSETITCPPLVYLGSNTWDNGSYTPRDLGTRGPTVTIQTGTRALVFMSAKANCDNPEVQSLIFIGVDVQDSSHRLTTYSSTDVIGANQGFSLWPMAGSTTQRGKMTLITGLTPGMNTFTMKYNTPRTTGTPPQVELHSNTYSNRRLIVLPL